MWLRNHLWGFSLKFLKRYSRSGLMDFTLNEISKFSTPVVVSVGGFGPVDTQLRNFVESRNGQFITLDIDPRHKPEILGDMTLIAQILREKAISPNIIIALEVLEHVPDFSKALQSCHDALQVSGALIISTPWIIPIHDRPHDYFRFTPAALKSNLSAFSKVDIFARGGYGNSIISLMLRGLFSGGLKGKFVMLFGIIFSILGPLPKINTDLESVDSCIGYISVAQKV